jgi:RNA polymerase sigma-70 factor (ECF subfamily)
MTTTEYNLCADEFADGVYRFILKNIKDEDKAKDIVQDSFMKMWDRHSNISFDKAKSYLFTTAYHTMIDNIRRDNKLSGLDADLHDPVSQENEYSDLNEILNNAVEKLPEIQKSVVLLRDYEGYSYSEIGDITNLNESQVKVYIYRARLFLKNYIGSLDTVI